MSDTAPLPLAWLHFPTHPGGARRVPVQPGQSLLEAALAGGVLLRRSCRNGSCRACMARLIEGTVHYRVDWPGLLAEEKAEGFVLPCVALPASESLSLVDWHRAD